MLKSGWNWSIGFSLGGVTLALSSPPWIKGTAKENVIHFNEGESHREVAAAGRGGQVSHEEPGQDLSFPESTELLRKKLDEFFAQGSDYDRIETYLRCLAFDSREGDARTRGASNVKDDGDASVDGRGWQARSHVHTGFTERRVTVR